MTKHSFRITKPVKELQQFLAKKDLKPLAELLIKAKVENSVVINKETDDKNKLAKLLIDGVLSNNYTAFTKELTLFEDEIPKLVKNAPILKPKEIIEKFSDALLEDDIDKIDELIDPKGSFIIIKNNYESVAVRKAEFLKWFDCRMEQKITSITKDACAGCSLGKTVVFYNNGSFPWNVLKMGIGQKLGIIFTFSKGKILGLSYCNSTKHKPHYKDYNDYKQLYANYQSQGFDIDDTTKLSKADWNKY